MTRIFQVREREPGEPLPDTPLRFPASDGTYHLGAEELQLARARGIGLDVVDELDARQLPVRFFLPHDGAVNDPPAESARIAVLGRLLAEGRAGGDVHIRFLGRNRSIPPDGFVLDRAGGARRYVWQVVPAEEIDAAPSLADRFRALAEHVDDPDRRFVLALGAGGLKLFAHATLLRLLERIGADAHVDEVWGSSAGALVALLYGHGLSPHAIEQTGYDLYSGRYQLPLRPSSFQMLRSLVREAILPRGDAASAGFVDCADGLQRMLAQYCDVMDPSRPFYCPAFNLATGRTDVLTSAAVPPHLADFVRRAGPRDAALASAAVPLLFVPRSVATDGGEFPYIDGSTTEGVPLWSVVRKFDADRAAGAESRSRLTILYVKLTWPDEAAERQRFSKLRLLQAIASAGIETTFERDVALLEQRDDVTLLGLHLPGSGPDFFETGRIPDFIRLAKESFPEQLACLDLALRSAA